MNEFDVAGLLQTYSAKAVRARTTKRLKEIIIELKKELDLRKVKVEDEDVYR